MGDKRYGASTENLESQILSLRNDAKKDDVLDFEQLGIDALFVDEAHVFKNLSIFSKIRNVAGISTNGSQRAMDMFQKIQYIQELTGGRNVILATGTLSPIPCVKCMSCSCICSHRNYMRRGLTILTVGRPILAKLPLRWKCHRRWIPDAEPI